ncbi:putative coiled-coil domain-containing protein 144C [Sciurus carolinensis]|uniref:putative coiled-coil domain-containing protein 144C n=1 Tax=Sciurus carolinensis TaxID=30640 RepID=UPI001FB1AA79|nr:putative coiled-coil domain-containing protein 144C [Sciurus carolinensis]
MVSTGSKSHVKEKSLCDAPLSSPVQKFVLEGKGEVCEKLQQSRNDVKCDPGNPKHQDLLHKNISESEREHMVSTGSKSHVKEKSLCDAPLSSPLPKFVLEGKGEVCEKLQQSRNDVKCDPGNPKHQDLLHKNISESEREHMVSTGSKSHVKEKSLCDAPLSSPLPKVSTCVETGKQLLDKHHRIEDIVTMLRLETDTIKHENQEKEKKYLEDIEIRKRKYDDLQKTIKIKEEILRENVFQYNEQYDNMKSEITMHIFQLEYEK